MNLNFSDENIYLSPYNELSIKVKKHLKQKYPNIKIKGFIDKNKTTIQINEKNAVVVISSPNYYNEIVNELNLKYMEKRITYIYCTIVGYKCIFTKNIFKYSIESKFYNIYKKSEIKFIQVYNKLVVLKNLFSLKMKPTILFLNSLITKITNGFFIQKNNSLFKLKDIYKGKTCLILGNGPSLKDVDTNIFSNYITFGSNGIFLKYTPDMYITISKDFYKNYKIEIKNLKVKHKFIDSSLTDIVCNETTSLKCLYPIYSQLFKYDFPVPISFSKRPDKFLFLGGTVIFAQIQLAVWMGFSEIILLGVDHNMILDDKKRVYGGVVLSDEETEGTHFSNNYKSAKHCDILATENAFKLAKIICEEHNIKILNATPNTKLKVIEQISINNLKLTGIKNG